MEGSSYSHNLGKRPQLCLCFFPNLPLLSPEVKKKQKEIEHITIGLALDLLQWTKQRKPSARQEKSIWGL